MKSIIVATDIEYKKILLAQGLKDLYWPSLLPYSNLIKLFDLATGQNKLQRLNPETAKSQLRFDIGHPLNGYVYVQNPCLENHYILPADANERLVKEKMGVFLKLAASLGAKKIELLSGQAIKKQGKGEVKVPLPDAAAQVGLSASFDGSETITRQVCFEWDEPHTPPFIPAGIEGWLNMDPILRNMVDSRLVHNLRNAQVSLKFEEVLSGCAEVTAKYGKLGFKVGGNYKEVYNSTWNYSIEYWPKRESHSNA
ncbi:MAG: hypothetical protein ACK46X_00275 [Candidatus Sericytochromatia bacterium]